MRQLRTWSPKFLARRLCATENLQRADLTSLEEVMALCELVDASLLEFSEEYAPLSAIQEPKWRVKTLLTKLDSDRRTGTDYFSHKFMGKVQEIFAGLPKPKDVRSFEGNDLPLLFTANEALPSPTRVRANHIHDGTDTKVLTRTGAGETRKYTNFVYFHRPPPRARGRTAPAVSTLPLAQSAVSFHPSLVRKFKIILIIMNFFS